MSNCVNCNSLIWYSNIKTPNGCHYCAPIVAVNKLVYCHNMPVVSLLWGCETCGKAGTLRIA